MICLGAAYCPRSDYCEAVGCLREPDPRPIDRLDEPRPALHFVGFRGGEYLSAVKVFGYPDFVHRNWDVRAATDVAEHDTVVFASQQGREPSRFSHDDSNQDGDPAKEERGR